MGTNKIIFLISAGLVIISTMIIVAFERKFGILEKEFSTQVEILKTWELPDELEEISGLVFIGANQVACVQDEEGIIFIYDLEAGQIEKQIPFTESGDFEGIAVNGTTAYVLESNGNLYEVADFMSQPTVKKYKTRLTKDHDAEGLFYDKDQDRLLVAVKRRDPESDKYKGIYSFNLDEKELEEKPVYTLTFKEKIFDADRRRNVQKIFKPSGIAIGPGKDIYLLEGATPKLLVLNSKGNPKDLHYLDDAYFPQPEGLAFDTQGTMYISSEGKPAMLHAVRIKN